MISLLCPISSDSQSLLVCLNLLCLWSFFCVERLHDYINIDFYECLIAEYLEPVNNKYCHSYGRTILEVR